MRGSECRTFYSPLYLPPSIPFIQQNLALSIRLLSATQAKRLERRTASTPPKSRSLLFKASHSLSHSLTHTNLKEHASLILQSPLHPLYNHHIFFSFSRTIETLILTCYTEKKRLFILHLTLLGLTSTQLIIFFPSLLFSIQISFSVFSFIPSFFHSPCRMYLHSSRIL